MPFGTDQLINLAARVPVTEAEGPGRRFAIWVQGCPFRCPGCCNPQYLAFREAEPITVEALLAEIASTPDLEGITLVGGEPFSQAAPLARLARDVQRLGLSVMIFTGHLRAELEDPAHPEFPARRELLSACDLLVDGRYESDQPDPRRWIGSRNQQIHLLSRRYRNLREKWDPTPDTIELRLVNGELLINGYPHPDITKLSRRQAGTSRESARP